MNTKERYDTPNMEIIELDAEDVIQTSAQLPFVPKEGQ